MKRRQLIQSSRKSATARELRRGWGMLDMFVAFTLLVATLAVVTPLLVRHNRLLESQRHYRIALEELTSQLDRLTAMPLEQLPEAVDQLSASEFVADKLPGAELATKLASIDGGTRITLTLSWNAPGRREAPVTLAGWVFSLPGSAASASEGGQP